MPDYIKYFFLEDYIIDEVNPRFHNDHSISAFDFFSIVIWKANRAKSKIALKLLANDTQHRRDLEAIVRDLTNSLYNSPDHKERMKLLIKEWHFALPMASAILCALWPDDFTVYDYRVCEQLQQFQNLINISDFENIWNGYMQFKSSLIKSTPNNLSLRDRDKYLWGKSFYEQLQTDINQLFNKDDDEAN
jgi:hypothetical protein